MAQVTQKMRQAGQPSAKVEEEEDEQEVEGVLVTDEK